MNPRDVESMSHCLSVSDNEGGASLDDVLYHKRVEG